MDEASNVANQRVRVRVPARLRVEYKLDGQVGWGFSTNLSETGLFLAVGRVVDLGTPIYLKLHLGPGEPAVKIAGSVRRIVPAKRGQTAGLGVRFETFFAQDAGVLRRFLSDGLGRKVREEDFGKTADGGLFRYVFEPDGIDGGEDGILPSTGPKPLADYSILRPIASSAESFEPAEHVRARMNRRPSEGETLQELEFSAGSTFSAKLLTGFFYLAVVSAILLVAKIITPYAQALLRRAP